MNFIKDYAKGALMLLRAVFASPLVIICGPLIITNKYPRVEAWMLWVMFSENAPTVEGQYVTFDKRGK